MKRIHVVAGIIFDKARKAILISRRPEHLHKGGCWEFPGGKVEHGELEQQALTRELKEELNLEFSAAEPFQQLNFDYPDKQVSLSFWSVYGVLNLDDVQGMESQEWRWVDIDKLLDYQFPEANEAVVAKLMSSVT